ncbi:MAG TPA: hypothetical protein VHO47_01730 [Candidatus Babeliales bacterium]|nr:hypothetical protein [Candidatus Babeliales bacterium]
MKKNHELLLFSLFLFNSTFTMENKEITHPVEIPDISRLIAYALVNVSIKTPGQLLSSILNFSKTSKKIRLSVFPLLCGYNNETGKPSNESAQFNNYALTLLKEHFTVQQLSQEISSESSPECLAAAYIGTPYALAILKKEYDLSINIEVFQKKLNRNLISILIASYLADRLSIGSLYRAQPESVEETLKKFPPSTRVFCKKLIEEKPKK